MASGTSPAEKPLPSLLGWPFARLPLWARLGLLVPVVAGLVVAGIAASREYPHSSAAKGSVLEQRIAEVTHDPTVESWDGAVLGDLLVERFYILDPATGKHYIGDFLKGRIEGVQTIPREDQPAANVFLLNSKDMRRDKAFYTAYLKAVSHPETIPGATYLGVIMPNGNTDAFPVNYNGDVPLYRAPFSQGSESDMYAYMFRQKFEDITGPSGITVGGGYVYVLNSSDVFPLFKDEFKLDKTIFMSELLTVDATSRPNRTTYYRLLEQVPRTAQ